MNANAILESRPIQVVMRTGTLFNDANVLRLAAAIAFYAVLALGPLFMIVLSVAAFFFGTAAVDGRVFNEVSGLLGPSGAALVEDVVRRSAQREKGYAFGAVGLVLFLWSASGVFSEIGNALASIRAVSGAPVADLKQSKMSRLRQIFSWGVGYLTQRLLSASMLMVIAFLLMVSLVISSIVSVATSTLPAFISQGGAITAINFGVSVFIFTVLTTLLLRLLGRPRLHWKPALAGGFVTSMIFSVGRWFVGFGIGFSASESTFGAAASLVVVLLWAWFCGIAALTGACFASVLDSPSDGAKAPTPAPDAVDPRASLAGQHRQAVRHHPKALRRQQRGDQEEARRHQDAVSR
jgi:membrane protein